MKPAKQMVYPMLFLCLREWTDETDDKGKATDSLGAMVAAVPRERAAAWITLRDPRNPTMKPNE